MTESGVDVSDRIASWTRREVGGAAVVGAGAEGSEVSVAVILRSGVASISPGATEGESLACQTCCPFRG